MQRSLRPIPVLLHSVAKVILNYNMDIDYDNQNTRMSQILEKRRRKILMQNMQRSRNLAMENSARELHHTMLYKESSMYIESKGLRL